MIPTWRTPAADALLTQLWADGLTTAQIGVRMGVSKNAIVGRAHRLGVPSRASPIIRDPNYVPTTSKIRRAGAVTLPLLPSLYGPPVPRAPRLALVPKAPRPEPAPPRAPLLEMRIHPTARCVFPFGEPGRPDFRFCDAPAVVGKPYCPACYRVAYVQLDDVRRAAG